MVTLAPVGISVQSAKPNMSYGQLVTTPLSATQAMFVRVGLPAAIAEDAVITSATLVFTQAGAITGSVTASLRRAAASFNVSRTTWNNQPALVGSTVSVAKSNTPATTQWSFDVTADVQAFAAGTASNFGWRIIATGTTLRFRGSNAAGGQPKLVIEYLEPGEAPEDLYPNGGAVSIAKPTLSFLVAPDTTAVQVQVDADTLGTADFDSGEVASTVGQLDLNATAYAGLSAGATTFWRARSRGGTGLTSWSPWASFSRATKPTVTITSPSTTSDDTTPPIQWSVSGGTQESWKVVVRNAAGAEVANSGHITSTATTWTPPRPLTSVEGTTVTIQVYVWDNVNRVSTPGDPEWATATRDVTLSTSAGVTNPATLTAVTDGITPAVVITATAASAPDSWELVRDGERLAAADGPPSTTFSFTDWTASPHKAHLYRAVRVVGGQRSAAGPFAVAMPTPSGVWLVDPTDGTTAVLWDADAGSWSAAELAVIHQPVAGPPIRRVAYRPPLSGSLSGSLTDAYGGSWSKAASETALYAFKSSEASRQLLLILGDRSIPVNVGDITIAPTPGSGGKRSSVSLSWWQVDGVPWTA